MPRLGNDRNELYCKARAKGAIPSKAAIVAGYAQGTSTTHLEKDAEIVARIAELTAEHELQREQQRTAAMEAAKMVGQMTGVTRAWVIQKLAENAQNAANDGLFKESNDALKLIGQDFGMFNGGSDDDESSNVPKTLDLDALSAVLNTTHEALEAPELSAIEQSKQFGPEVALELIQGQTKPMRLAEERELSTGSETDVAFRVDSMPDEDFEPIPDEPDEFSEPS